MLSSLR